MAFDLSKLLSSIKKDAGSPKKKGVVGIDIGSSTIKIIQLSDTKGVPTLETYGELQLGPYDGVDLGRSVYLTQQKLIEAFIDILREADVSGKEAFCALSYNASFISTIFVPTLDPEQISKIVPVEARKYIPTALSNVTLDWVPLATNTEKKATTVLLSAVYNDAMQRYRTVVKGGGLEMAVTEIETFSTIRSTLLPEDEVVLILDWGALSTRLCIVENGVPKKTHSVPLSGVTLTNALIHSLSIEFKEAEEVKRSVGLFSKTNDTRVQKILIGEIERGLRELHTVAKRHELSEGVVIQKIRMCGSGALLQGLSTYVGDLFSIPVELADPFAKVAYPAFLEDTLESAGPSFSVAVGIALRAFQK